MNDEMDSFDFENSVLKSNKYLIINQLGVINNYFKGFFSVLYFIPRAFLVSVLFPIIWTVIPAIINFTEQEWLYGVFFLGSLIGYLFTKVVNPDKANLLKSLVAAIDLNQHATRNLNNIYSKVEKVVSFSQLKRSRSTVELDAASLCEGHWREDKKIHWVEPISVLLIMIYFFRNPDITILSREYLDFIIAISFVTVDVVVNGLFSSLSEITILLPDIKTNGNISDIIVVGLIRFFIVLFLTKLIIDRYKLSFTPKIWFEGNSIGLWLFIKKYLNSFSEKEGSLIIYDFGIRREFGENKAFIILSREVKKRAEFLINKLLKYDTKLLKNIEIKNNVDPDFDEAQKIKLYLEHENFFKNGYVGIDIAADDKWPSIYHYTSINFNNVIQIRYDVKEQKLYFCDTSDQNIDSGIVILFPYTILLEMSNKINFVFIENNMLSGPISFPLIVDGDTQLNSKLFRKVIFSIPRGNRKTN